MKSPSQVKLDLLAWEPLRGIVLWPGFPLLLQAAALAACVALITFGLGTGPGLKAEELLVLRKTNLTTLAVWALALVANRLCEPTSEHGIGRWLETEYVCDRSGKRWLPEWRDDAEWLSSRRPRQCG